MLESIVTRFGEKLFLAFMLIAIIPIYIFEVAFNEPYIFAFKYLTIPIFIVVYYIFWFKMPLWRSRNSILKGVFFSFLFASLAVLMSGGYVIGFNAWAGSQESIEISGAVTNLGISKGKNSTSYVVTLNDQGLERKLEVNYTVYADLKIGEVYTDHWHKGSLGLIYRRK